MSTKELSPSQIVGIAIGAVLFLVGGYFFCNPGLLEKVSVVIWHNFGIWILFIFGAGYAIYRKISNPQQMTWVEIPVQLSVSLLAIYLFYSIFYYSTSGMQDTEIWNGYVAKAEYHEAWTEKKTSTDDEGNTRTSYVYHAPEWKLITNNDECLRVSSDIYRRYVSHWGKETKRTLWHMNQSSIGDGNMYFVNWNRDSGSQVPSAVEHECANYLKASHSIRKRVSYIKDEHKPFLMEYPAVFDGGFGSIAVNRVLNAKASVPTAWSNKISRGLDKVLCTMGKEKEVNVLVYVMGIGDQGYFHALEEHWIGGKKNDVILVIGASEFPKIDWVTVMAWTDVEEFKILLRDRILALKNLEGKEQEIVDTISDQIRKSADAGGFKRRHMKELEYLAADIVLPWWAQVLVICFSVSCAYATSWALEHNEISN